MNIEMLENLPNAWVVPVMLTAAGLFAVTACVAAIRYDNLDRAKKIFLLTLGGALAAVTIVIGTVGVIEENRFKDSNTGAVAQWLDTSYGLEATDEDRGTIARIVLGDAREQTFTFTSEEGPLVAKVVESPDGIFGLVKVAEPVTQLD